MRLGTWGVGFAIWVLGFALVGSAQGRGGRGAGAGGADNQLKQTLYDMLAAVNAYRASRTPALPPISESQIDTNRLSRVDLRVTKGFAFGGRKIELVGQVFNLFGTDNLGGIGSSQVGNATAQNFGQIPSAQPRQQGEVAIRYVF